MTGTLVGIARVSELRAPMEQLAEAAVTVESGIAGDARGTKPGRQVTVLFREGWQDACTIVGRELPWTTRRANLLVAGIERPRVGGGTIRIGEVVLQVTMETEPCMLMERAQAGLRQALAPDWRAGVCCRVLQGGTLRIGEAVSLVP